MVLLADLLYGFCLILGLAPKVRKAVIRRLQELARIRIRLDLEKARQVHLMISCLLLPSLLQALGWLEAGEEKNEGRLRREK